MIETEPSDNAISRRTALRSAAGAAGGALLAQSAGAAAAQSNGPDFGGWFDNVSNFDGVVDRTGQDEVTVTVGAEGNNGNLAFGPAAVRVDPGTTVIWEWNGEGGGHNVIADDGSYDSGEQVAEAGYTFSHTFESEGISKYYCAPHQMLGMKGAVVVGQVGTGGGGGPPDYGNFFQGVSNYDGETVDARGQDEVTVAVGSEGNNGNLAFDPPAVHVDNGATVVWEWTGEGGGHNVVANDDTFDSGEQVGEEGYTFSHTFESDGLYRYVCEPHVQLGMKGAVVVGTDYPSTGGGGGGITRPENAGAWLTIFAGALLGLFMIPFGFAAYMRRQYPDGVPAYPEADPPDHPTAQEASAVDPDQVERLDHDEFDPKGTLSLVLLYLAILVLMWFVMYFVEFLGGPTVVG
jgi:halocyanin-like protein